MKNEPPTGCSKNGSITVMLVEDDYAVRETTRAFLEVGGYKVIPAEDGVEVVELFRDLKDSIDLVLLDYTMPKMSGGETLDAMRQLDQNVKVIVLSGQHHDSAIEGMLEAGALGSLAKPYKMEQLLSMAKDCIES